jgi:hypothetical protein
VTLGTSASRVAVKFIAVYGCILVREDNRCGVCGKQLSAARLLPGRPLPPEWPTLSGINGKHQSRSRLAMRADVSIGRARLCEAPPAEAIRPCRVPPRWKGGGKPIAPGIPTFLEAREVVGDRTSPSTNTIRGGFGWPATCRTSHQRTRRPTRRIAARLTGSPARSGQTLPVSSDRLFDARALPSSSRARTKSLAALSGAA